MEIGHAAPDPTSSAAEVNWDLRWPQSIRQYSRMAREDSQAKSVLKAVTLPIRRTTWRIDPNGAPADVVRLVAEDLRLPVLGEDGRSPVVRTGGHASWKRHLYWVLKSLVYGHAFFEPVFKEIDGRDRLWKLAYRPPETISEIMVARDGGLVGIKQKPAPGDRRRGPTIDVDHLLAYLHEPEDTSWVGESALRAAYKHWILKDRFMRLEDQVLDRNGMGIPTYTAAGETSEEREEGKETVRKVRAGTAAGVTVPRDAKFALTGVSGQIVSPREAIAYHDSMIGRSLLAHFLNLEGKGGSYSLAEVQERTFVDSLQSIAEDTADTANEYLIERMVNLAFDVEAGPYPRIVFDPIGSKKELVAEALAALKNAKLITADRALEEHLRRKHELPPMDFVVAGDKSEELKAKADAVTALVEAGMDRDEAMQAVGLTDEVEVTDEA